MGFIRTFPLNIRTNGNLAEVATDASSYVPIIAMPASGEVVRARFINGTASALTSGTTAGSSASITLYKNASHAASVIATFNGSGTTVATLGTAVLNTSGTAGTTNGRFVAGDLLIGEFTGGAATVVGAGALIEVDYIYGRETAAVPSAASSPA